MTASAPRVLFVSKAVIPPYRDGAICLVHGLATSANRSVPTVMSTRDAPALPHVQLARIYGARSRYAPALHDNARVLAHLLLDRSHDVWHFVFAPNPVTSRTGHLLRSARRKPVLQTVASQPRSYDGTPRLLFGDRVVALSRHTAERLVQAGAAPRRIEVIPPPVHDLVRDETACKRARAQAGIPDGAPVFLYPGDLEFSHGAQVVADAAPAILASIPDAYVVLACRAKTPRARDAQLRLQHALRDQPRVVFGGEVPDLPALMASATAVVFPVDDLYGKVDLPYALLEAALLGVPVVVDASGPLREIEHAIHIESRDPRGLADACVRLARDEAERSQIGQAMRSSARGRHDPRAVMDAYEQLYEGLARGRL